jgi:LmbE family N-acetylglucosaminyl deacetylase
MSAPAQASRASAVHAGECVLVWAPHPDDEVLAAGTLIQRALARAARVHVTIVTDGDAQSWAQRIVEHRWRIRAGDRDRWGVRRRSESLAGLRALGLPTEAVRFLGVPDRAVTAGLLAAADPVVTALAGDLERVRPTLLVVPALADRHPDHSALAVAARLALARSGPAPVVLEYLIHGRRPAATIRLAAHGDELARKRAAVLCHGSQIAVHRRRLLAFVQREEFRSIDAPLDRERVAHPVRELVRLGNALCVEVSLPRTRRATLLLRAAADATAGISCSIVRSGSSAPGAAVGGGVPARVWVARSGARALVVLAVSPATAAGRWFAKLDLGDGWFDAAGWREFPSEHQEAPASLPRPPTSASIFLDAVAGVAG